MIVKKPQINMNNEKFEEFYKFKLSSNFSYNYLLTDNELKNFGYVQHPLKNLKGVVLLPKDENTDSSVNKSMLEKYDPSLVYVNPGKGGAFGDSIGWISFVCRLSEASNKKIKLARLPVTCENIYKNILKTSGTYEIVENPSYVFNLSNDVRKGYREVYSRLFLPSKIEWKRNNNKLVAVQFGRRGLTDRLVQDPKDELRIIDALEKKGYTVKHIGGELGDIGCMQLAAECQFFVGTCSGMSHLCHSVGTPVHMLTNKRSLERVSAGHVKNTRCIYPTVFWQHPNHIIEYINNNL
jgi:hypothetical protein